MPFLYPDTVVQPPTSSFIGMGPLCQIEDDCRFLGNPYYKTGVGNLRMQGASNWPAKSFVAKETGFITRTSWYSVHDDTDPSGYGAGDRGGVSVHLQADAGGVPSGTDITSLTIAQINRNDCTADANLYDRAFDAPGAVTAGQRYWLVYKNPDPDPANNWHSINFHNYGSDDFSPFTQNPDEIAFTFGDGTAPLWRSAYTTNGGGSWQNDTTPSSQRIAEYFPLMKINYQSGAVQGSAWKGTWSATHSISGATYARTTDVVKPGVSTLTSMHWCHRYGGGEQPNAGRVVEGRITNLTTSAVLMNWSNLPLDQWWNIRTGINVSVAGMAGNQIALDVRVTSGTAGRVNGGINSGQCEWSIPQVPIRSYISSNSGSSWNEYLYAGDRVHVPVYVRTNCSN